MHTNSLHKYIFEAVNTVKIAVVAFSNERASSNSNSTGMLQSSGKRNTEQSAK